MKAVLVTGASGFLGRHIVHHFVRRGWQVFGIGSAPPSRQVRSLLKRYFCWTLPDRRLGPLLRGLSPIACVHCAGPASVSGSFADPVADFAAGPGLLGELLEQVRLFSPASRFIFLSSAAVYGNPTTLPITEEATAAPISPYGFHKWQGELLCAEYAALFGLKTASLRIFSAFGRGLRRQVLWDACNKLTGEDRPTFQGTGFESRDFIHAADIARAVDGVLHRAPLCGETYNVATGRETSIATVLKMIAASLGVQKHIEFDGIRPPGVPVNWRADIAKISGLGFRPRISLVKGLADYLAWFRREVACPSYVSA